MLESWLAPLLMQLLGDYVKPECFDSNSVHLSVWGGYCALSNLELKPEALDVLQLPVALKRGFIGRIEFQLPWGTPGTKPTVVKIDEVYLLLETKYEWIGARAEARSRAATRSKLEHVTAAQARVAELRAKRVALRELRAAARATAAPQTSSGKTGAAVGGDPGDDDSSGDDEDVDAALAAATAANGAAASLAAVRSAAPGFIEKLFTKLLDNLQLHVRGVHIRWEDSCSLPMPRSAGGGTAATISLGAVGPLRPDSRSSRCTCSRRTLQGGHCLATALAAERRRRELGCARRAVHWPRQLGPSQAPLASRSALDRPANHIRMRQHRQQHRASCTRRCTSFTLRHTLRSLTTVAALVETPRQNEAMDAEAPAQQIRPPE